MGSFCTRCKSLMPPGTVRCKVCGSNLGEFETKQSSIIDGFEKIPVESKQNDTPRVQIKENTSAPFLPYEPRPTQLRIISDIVEALSESKHIVVESGTGTGKTICSLASGLQHAKENNKKILYLTRTISQSDQVMNELRAIDQIKPVSGITLTGRKRSCPHLRSIKGYEDLSPKALSSICEEQKVKSARGPGGCRFFDGIKHELYKIEEYCKKYLPTSEDLDDYCESLNVCPFEAKKAIISQMDVVVAPYVHILSEDIRSNLLLSMKCNEDELLLIVDEAHNLVEAARDQESFEIRTRMVDSAISECDSLREATLTEDVRLKDFLIQVKNTIRSTANEMLDLTVRECRLPGNLLESSLIGRFNMNQLTLQTAIDKMIDLGEDHTERMLDQGNNRISEIYMIGVALKDWTHSSEDQYIKSVKTDDQGEYFSAACIDPKDITFFLRGLKGAIHMSGTLQPLEQYIGTIGLPNTTVRKIYPSPFPKENRSVIYVNDLTTKYDEMKKDPTMFTRMQRTVAKLCNAVDKNTLVFFPSYVMMSKMRPFLERDVKKEMYWEESKQQKRTMAALDSFRNGRNGVFFTVMGGSIAEGIDFPGDELCFAIIVGIPYPPPTLESKAMSELFDQRFAPGLGWKYTSEVPAMRKIKQAVGRLIRTETDRGMAVILDSRISKYEKQLDARPSKDPAKDAVNFFRQV